jgi:lysophospholipase L1-like esterase
MRRRTLLTLAVLAGLAVVVLAAVARHRNATTETLPGSSIALIGDSLNLGTEEPLRAALRQWTFRTDDVVGRRTAAGLARLAAAGSSLPPYVVVSLGTNDPASDVAAFRAEVARAVKLVGPSRCLVWATIHRDGGAYDAFNAVLLAEAARNRNVRVVEWGAMIEAHPDWLAPDGIHGTPDGYLARAAAVVEAMRACHAAGSGG